MFPFIVPYHNTVENMNSGGKITVDCVTCIRNRREKIIPQTIIGTPSFGKSTIHRLSNHKFNSI